ncbi:glycoside hydrolase [Alternaria alternata]|nr:glycoside hydrolase [Alternaria alternata]
MGTGLRVHVLLGPVAGPLGRSPFDEGNWEGISPDASLSGELVAVTVRRTQSVSVRAATKHLIAKERDIRRDPTLSVNRTTIDMISSYVDDKTMHETYPWSFADVVRERTASVTCSFQRINGSHGCQDSDTLNNLLKGEPSFSGFVGSDWYATLAGVPSANAGLIRPLHDIDMTSSKDYISGPVSSPRDNTTSTIEN